LTIIRIN